jgi:hypothetical protein
MLKNSEAGAELLPFGALSDRLLRIVFIDSPPDAA